MTVSSPTITPRHAITGNPLLLAAALLVLVAYGVLCGSTGHDDSHINFWNAYTLLEFGSMENYNGERIEQTTCLLLDVLTALLALVSPFSVVTSGYLVNLAGAIGVLWLSARMARQQAVVLFALPALLTALTPYFSYWAYSGMGTTLAAFSALLFLQGLIQHIEKNSSATAWTGAIFLATIRPEMLLIGPAFLVCFSALYRKPALLVLLLPFIAVMLWQYLYFGMWMANPVYAKSGHPGFEQVQAGIKYASRLFRNPVAAVGVALTWLVLAIAIFKSCFPLKKNTLATACALWLLIYGGFVIASGGDWMKEGRFWVPLVAPMWLLVTSITMTGVMRFANPVFAALLLCYTPAFIQQFNGGTPLWLHQQLRSITSDDASFFETASREHVRDWRALQAFRKTLQLLEPETGKPLTIMSKQMGMIAYHLNRDYHGRIRVWDMAGLVENTLRSCAAINRDGYDSMGLRINYRNFFARLPQAEKECGLQAPDIIYDIYGWGETIPLPDFLRTQGYTIVFNQTGRVDMKPGMDITAQEMIAVRSTLIEKSGKTLPEIQLDFNSLMKPTD